MTDLRDSELSTQLEQCKSCIESLLWISTNRWAKSTCHQSLATMRQALQYVQANFSSRGKTVPIDAGHAIFRDRPEALVGVMLDMIADIVG